MTKKQTGSENRDSKLKPRGVMGEQGLGESSCTGVTHNLMNNLRPKRRLSLPEKSVKEKVLGLIDWWNEKYYDGKLSKFNTNKLKQKIKELVK